MQLSAMSPATPQAAPLFPQLLRRALQLVRECGCARRAGCPACTNHTDCGEYNSALHKRAAAVVLETLVEGAPRATGEAAEGAGQQQDRQRQQETQEVV